MPAWGAAALVLLLVAGGSIGAAAPASRPAVHQVAIDGATYRPDALTIALGDTVVWTNKDPYPHTVTSKDGGFDSKQIAPGKTFRLKPTKRGEFHYICELHQTMHGTLTVK